VLALVTLTWMPVLGSYSSPSQPSPRSACVAWLVQVRAAASGPPAVVVVPVVPRRLRRRHCIAVWWNDRAINTHSESGAVVPDEDHVPSPGWALGKTGFHTLGAQCKDKCGSCTKCKRYDTWGVTYGSDSLKDDQPLKPATYGVEWVLVKEHILDSVTAAEATAAEGNDAEMTQ